MDYHDPDDHSSYHSALPSYTEWNQGSSQPNGSPLAAMHPSVTSSPPINSPISSTGGPPGSMVMPPSFIDLPSSRSFVPHYWSSPVARNDGTFLPPATVYNIPRPPSSMNLMYTPAPLTQRSSAANLRVPHQAMALGYGPPPIYPGPLSHSPWPTVAPTSLAASSDFPTMASPTFAMPVSPLDGSGRLHHDPNLLSAHDYSLTRTDSTSSMASSVDSGLGHYYTPMSSQGGSDYVSHEDELRHVSATAGGLHHPQESGNRIETSDLPPVTIHLARIHEGRAPVKLEIARSVSESDSSSQGAPSIYHSSPQPQTVFYTPYDSVKTERFSPLPEPIPSPVSSVYTETMWSTGSPRVPEVKPESTQSLPPPCLAKTTNSPNSHYDPLEEDDGFATPDDHEDDEFRPVKRPRGRKSRAPRRRWATEPSQRSSSEKSDDGPVSLTVLVKRYPLLPEFYPLFYQSLLDDLTLHPMAAPKIGTIPNSVIGVPKCDLLRDFWHRGKRKLQQLDAFTAHCNPRNESTGNHEAWADLSESYRIAIRDVRRKIVERTENYKYTRRDILTKIFGKGNCVPIEHNMVWWDSRSGNNDPCRDLVGPWALQQASMSDTGSGHGEDNTPGASVASQRAVTGVSSSSHDVATDGRDQDYLDRQIRPMPSRSFLSVRPSNPSIGPSAAATTPPRAACRRSAPSPPSRRNGGSSSPHDVNAASFVSASRTLGGHSLPSAGGAAASTQAFSNLALSPTGDERNPRLETGSGVAATFNQPMASHYHAPGAFSSSEVTSSTLGLTGTGTGTGNVAQTRCPDEAVGCYATLRPMHSHNHTANTNASRRRSYTPDSDWDEDSSTASFEQ